MKWIRNVYLSVRLRWFQHWGSVLEWWPGQLAVCFSER